MSKSSDSNGIVIATGPKWEGLYLNGYLITEGLLTAADALSSLGIHYEQRYVDRDWLRAIGNSLPLRLQDVAFPGEFPSQPVPAIERPMPPAPVFDYDTVYLRVSAMLERLLWLKPDDIIPSALLGRDLGAELLEMVKIMLGVEDCFELGNLDESAWAKVRTVDDLVRLVVSEKRHQQQLT